MKHFSVLIAAVVVLAASAAFAGVVVEDRDNPFTMEVAGDQLFLNKQSGRIVAPDGKYFLKNNTFLVVIRGKISPTESSALKNRPDLAGEVARGRTTSQGLRNPGSTRMFNPQPEPPGGQLAPVGQQAK